MVGSSSPAPAVTRGSPDERNYQIYSPSYLFKGARPAITSVPSDVRYGASIFVQTPDAASVTSVIPDPHRFGHALLRPERPRTDPSVQSDRWRSRRADAADGNTAPPGYYLLSIVNGNGVPSVSAMVRFAAPGEDAVAPTAPSGLAAVGGVGKVDLSWTAGTDNIGVARYDVYRSTTAGFVPGPSTQVAQVPGNATTFRDSGLAAGTYHYRVKTEDAAANLSPASNEASAAATAPSGTPSITVDKLVSTHQGTGASTVSATGVTTTGSQELLLAFLSSDGPSGAGTARFAGVTGGGLTWTLRQRSNAQAGTAEIWQATAPAR